MLTYNNKNIAQLNLVTVGRVWVDGDMQGAFQDISVGTLPSPCINFSGVFQDSISAYLSVEDHNYRGSEGLDRHRTECLKERMGRN